MKTLSRISSYSPFIGPNGLIRSTGRIQRLSATAFEARHPIILDSHRLIRCFLRFYHIKHTHQSVDYLRSVIHQQFAVIRLRSAQRAIETHCVCCRQRKAKTVTPMMSELPAEHLGYRQPPFSNCSVDYVGTFHVNIRRSSEKRWGFLFTRAIHIELVPSMDASSCVMAIERFISRRGAPSIIWSGNGTNVVGAEKSFFCASKIGTQKLQKLERLTNEILNTTMCLVEGSLNARPFTPISDDPDSLKALTPNHFLLWSAQSNVSVSKVE